MSTSAAGRPCRLRLDRLEDRTTPATLTVTSLNDAGPGSLRAAVDLANQDAAPDTIVFDPAVRGKTVTLTTFGNPSGGTATDPEPAGPSGLLVRTAVTIQGTGETITRGSLTSLFRLLRVTASGDLTLRNLTLSGGSALGVQGGAGGASAGMGGAVYNQGALQVFGCTLTNNAAFGGDGSTSGVVAGAGLGGPGDASGHGGAPNGGVAVGTDGGFGGGGARGKDSGDAFGGTGGSGGFGGGGAAGGFGGSVFESPVTFGFPGGHGGAGGFGGGGGAGGLGGFGAVSGTGGSGGFGGGSGGMGGLGVSASGGGGAGLGGAVFNQGGRVVIADSTLTGNAADGGASGGLGASAGGAGSGFGGGVFNLNGSLTLTHATIAANQVVAGKGAAAANNGRAGGGAVYNLALDVGTATPGTTATLTVANCILARTSSASDVVNDQSKGNATLNATGPNIVSAAVVNTGGTTSGIPFIVADPQLGSFNDNGGPTRTMAPLAGSPAIDAGLNTAAAGLATDQRGAGFVRLSNGIVDIGAVEFQVPVVLAPTSLPGGVVGVAYSQTLTASGPPGPFTFAVAAGTLPAGLTLGPTGTLTGTPTATGTASVTITATNGTAEVVSRAYEIPIGIVSPPPPPGSPSPVTRPAPTPFLLGGPADGSARLLFPGGTLGTTFVPSPGTTVRTAVADVTGDEVPDVIVGAGPGSAGGHVRILNGTNNAVVAEFNTFEDAFTGGVFVAAADIDADGRAEVVVTADESGGPVVAIYRGSQLAAGVGGPPAQLTRFFGIAGDPNFRGGCRPALGDLNGDGSADLVVSAGVKGGPRIAVFDGRSMARGIGDPGRLVGDFFAFEDTLRNGAFVAAGDVTGDGRADIAFGGGPGGAPRVRLFDGNALLSAPAFGNVDAIAGPAQRANFFAGDAGQRGGVRLALHDIDGDGAADLAAGSGAGEASRARVYRAATLLAGATAADQDFDPFGTVLANGVFVG